MSQGQRPRLAAPPVPSVRYGPQWRASPRLQGQTWPHWQSPQCLDRAQSASRRERPGNAIQWRGREKRQRRHAVWPSRLSSQPPAPSPSCSRDPTSEMPDAVRMGSTELTMTSATRPIRIVAANRMVKDMRRDHSGPCPAAGKERRVWGRGRERRRMCTRRQRRSRDAWAGPEVPEEAPHTVAGILLGRDAVAGYARARLVVDVLAVRAEAEDEAHNINQWHERRAHVGKGPGVVGKEGVVLLHAVEAAGAGHDRAVLQKRGHHCAFVIASQGRIGEAGGALCAMACLFLPRKAEGGHEREQAGCWPVQTEGAAQGCAPQNVRRIRASATQRCC